MSTLGFRRRCGWCAVQLRWWQINLCRRCGHAVAADAPSPPVRGKSRWGATPDLGPLALYRETHGRYRARKRRN